MPTAPNLSTAVVAGNTTHLADTNTVHGIINNIYKTTIGTTRTSAYTLTQANSGEVIPVNSSSSVAITVPSLQAGTEVTLVRLGSGAVTLTASGTTLTVPAGATATPRVQGSSMTLIWLTTTSVVVGGDLVVPATPVTPPAGGTQTLGVGGVATPGGAILTTGNSSSALNITTSGTSGAQRVYDGGGFTVGRINVTANYVTVQNFRINAQSQYGAVLDGNNITFQNNDIKGVILSGDGDLNAITAWGNNIKILYNTAINYVSGDPGGSHTDFIQTWVSTSHPVPSSGWAIVGNKATGPSNPGRVDSIASIHQAIMVEDYGRGGNSGGQTTGIANWFIADNEFLDSWNQCIKIDGGDNFVMTRNKFTGDSDHVIEVTSGSGNLFYADNIVGTGYGDVGYTITSGSGPATPTYV